VGVGSHSVNVAVISIVAVSVMEDGGDVDEVGVSLDVEVGVSAVEGVEVGVTSVDGVWTSLGRAELGTGIQVALWKIGSSVVDSYGVAVASSLYMYAGTMVADVWSSVISTTAMAQRATKHSVKRARNHMLVVRVFHALWRSHVALTRV
jgi:hypothetical protein